MLTAPLATLASSLALELLNCWDSLSSLARDSLAQSQGTEALASQAATPAPTPAPTPTPTPIPTLSLSRTHTLTLTLTLTPIP